MNRRRISGLRPQNPTKAIPDFRVEVIEMIQAEGNTVVVQATLGGTMPDGRPWDCEERSDLTLSSRLHPTLHHGRQNLAPRLLLGQHSHKQHQGQRFVTSIEREYRHKANQSQGLTK